MPSVDDLLRQAFEPTDDEWVRRAPAAHARVVARHRREQAVRRGAAVVGLAGVAAAAVLALGGDLGGPSRSVDPVAPPPAGTTLAAGTTPLEGTWTSAPLGRADVRAAARAAGAPEAVPAMLAQLPAVPFRVVVDVQGARLTTTVSADGADGEVLDRESLSVSGGRLEVRPYAMQAATTHAWVISGSELTMSFVRTTEPRSRGVPGEAWQRLLYDSVPFAARRP
jgi:hypothetical protein